jgi:uncharacterized repeat protein (TIGR03806 family)
MRALAALLLALCGCTAESLGPVSGAYPERLSELGFFVGPLADLAPAPGVLPYAPRAQLWADHAAKDRFLVLPPGKPATFHPGEDWRFPVGTVIIKTFLFPADVRVPEGGRTIVETRLLILEEEGFTAHVYLWNAEQTEAARHSGGKRVAVSFVDTTGVSRSQQYVVPNTNQCLNCHARGDVVRLLGVTTPQLNHTVVRDGAQVNQLAWLAEHGVFGGDGVEPSVLPAFSDPFGEGDVEPRARAWLHANCGHCHRDGGAASHTGLWLTSNEKDDRRLGVCKTPIAAGAGTGGHQYDVVPGKPKESILAFRIGSTDPEIKMPELPNKLPDAQGLDLVEQWIAGLPPAACP